MTYLYYVLNVFKGSYEITKCVFFIIQMISVGKLFRAKKKNAFGSICY